MLAGFRWAERWGLVFGGVGLMLGVVGSTGEVDLSRKRAAFGRALAELAAPGAARETYETAVALAELPDMVRPYEAIELGNVERYRTRLTELLARLEGPKAPTGTAAPLVV